MLSLTMLFPPFYLTYLRVLAAPLNFGFEFSKLCLKMLAIGWLMFTAMISPMPGLLWSNWSNEDEHLWEEEE